ncbi:MAG: hypothetical protein ACMUEM_04815 [Flavobacteriales bacterium AspAUS03]
MNLEGYSLEKVPDTHRDMNFSKKSLQGKKLTREVYIKMDRLISRRELTQYYLPIGTPEYDALKARWKTVFTDKHYPELSNSVRVVYRKRIFWVASIGYYRRRLVH